MKYTRSRDGIMRVNLRATIRVTREEMADLSKLAKEEGEESLRQFLYQCLRDGIYAAQSRAEDDAKAMAEEE